MPAPLENPGHGDPPRIRAPGAGQLTHDRDGEAVVVGPPGAQPAVERRTAALRHGQHLTGGPRRGHEVGDGGEAGRSLSEAVEGEHEGSRTPGVRQGEQVAAQLARDVHRPPRRTGRDALGGVGAVPALLQPAVGLDPGGRRQRARRVVGDPDGGLDDGGRSRSVPVRSRRGDGL